jgi:hypothetical protein
MAKNENIVSPRRRSKVEEKARGWEFPLDKQNLIWLGIGVAVILIGYLFMSTGITEEAAVVDGKWNNFMAVTLAPIILVIGYCGVIPFAILKDFSKNKKIETES